MDNNYEPFGDEWKKEMMKFPKRQMIDFCAKIITDHETALADRMENVVEALEHIENWSRAYPVNIFPEPTKEQWAEMAKVLDDNGFVLDAISASNMRHVVTGVGKIAADALAKYDATRSSDSAAGLVDAKDLAEAEKRRGEE